MCPLQFRPCRRQPQAPVGRQFHPAGEAKAGGQGPQPRAALGGGAERALGEQAQLSEGTQVATVSLPSANARPSPALPFIAAV